MSDTTNLKQSADTIRNVLADYRDTLDLQTQQALLNVAETLEKDEPTMLVVESILSTEVEQREANYYQSYHLGHEYENTVPEETNAVFEKNPFNAFNDNTICTLSRVSPYGKDGLTTFSLNADELDKLCSLWIKMNIVRQREIMEQEAANASLELASDEALDEHPF